MNDPVFELAKQADIIEWDALASGVRTPDHESVAKARKFAELIIQECIFTIESAANGYQDYRNQIEDAMRNHCVWLIKHKFGVE